MKNLILEKIKEMEEVAKSHYKKDFLTIKARERAEEIENVFNEYEERQRKFLGNPPKTREEEHEYLRLPPGYSRGFLLGGLDMMTYSIFDGGKIEKYRMAGCFDEITNIAKFARSNKNEMGCFKHTTLTMKNPQIILLPDLTYFAFPADCKFSNRGEK